MPELPEVEALAGFLTGRLAGRTVEKAHLAAFPALKTYDPPLSALEGREFHDVTRHGKFLDLRAGDLHLIIHLARAGWLRWYDSLPTAPPRAGKGPLVLRIRLTEPADAEADSNESGGPGNPGGHGGPGFDVTEAGTQKRLAIYVVTNPGDVPGIARLGIDPLSPEFTPEALARLLDGERRQIKGVLRDQGTIAGIGNAYSDEILHAARMSPFALAARLSPDDVARLHGVIISTLTDAVERARELKPGELKSEKKLGLRVHGRTGQACPVCGDTIREVSFSDSALQYCPTCQTGGKPLADRRLSRLLK
jgi:formamidopyrimidine-DNA glycosylase